RLLRFCLLDRRRGGEGRRHRRARPVLPAHRPRLPDRRGGAGFRGDARGRRSLCALRHARKRGRGGARGGAGEKRRDRAALAGLRLIRPVQRFRGARRALPRPRPGAAGSAPMSFARSDQSIVAQWWWTVDRWTLLALAMLIGMGSLMVMAASPAVAVRIGADSLHFVRHYFAVLPATILVMFVVSLQSPRGTPRIAAIGFVISLLLLALTFPIGTEIKGARPWIELPGLSIQPSEFIKPTFAVVSAWLFAQYRLNPGFPGHWIAIGLFVLVIGLLIKQPDLGMTVVIAAVWF